MQTHRPRALVAGAGGVICARDDLSTAALCHCEGVLWGKLRWCWTSLSATMRPDRRCTRQGPTAYATRSYWPGRQGHKGPWPGGRAQQEEAGTNIESRPSGAWSRLHSCS